MIDGKSVIAWTPYGRAKTVSILIEYLKRDHDKGVLDEYWLFLNTDPDQVDDLRYAYELAEQHPWIHLKERPAGLPFRTPKQRNTGAAYRHMTDPNAVYVRFDDDIIYVHEDMLTNLVRAKIAMTGTLCAFALCWNNAIVSWFEQQVGNIPREFGVVERPFCMDPVGWASGDFGIAIHRLLLDRIEAGQADSVYLYQDMPLAPRQQFSVSCFATLGSEYAALNPPGVLPFDEEESCHTQHWPELVGKTNQIIGNALVSHFTFGPQRHRPEHAAVFNGEILDRYRALAQAL